jgi:hypothetical protein
MPTAITVANQTIASRRQRRRRIRRTWTREAPSEAGRGEDGDEVTESKRNLYSRKKQQASGSKHQRNQEPQSPGGREKIPKNRTKIQPQSHGFPDDALAKAGDTEKTKNTEKTRKREERRRGREEWRFSVRALADHRAAAPNPLAPALISEALDWGRRLLYD